MLEILDVIQQLQACATGGLIAFVAPVICGVFWFAVIAIWAMLRKWLHKEPLNPIAWYD